MRTSIKALAASSTLFPKNCKPFGLERGEEESQNTHITTKEFYQELEKTRKEVQNLDLERINLIPAATKTEMIKRYAKTAKLDLNLEGLKEQKNKGFKR